MQELADKVWSNPMLHPLAGRLQRAWIAREIGMPYDDPPRPDEIARLVEAAAILACSETLLHRRLAHRLVTSAFELQGSSSLPLDQAVRVVLTRLGNFPAFATRASIRDAQPLLPLGLLAEEIVASDRRTIDLGGRRVVLTDFQHELWTRLRNRRRVAVAAPTSAGKSFVLQSFLTSLFDQPSPVSVLYLVPTRALISQVATAIRAGLDASGPETAPPLIVTVPIEGALRTPPRVIYVMTQERAQIMLAAHADFAPEVIVVDEAHGVADGARGVRLQAALAELLRRAPRAQTLFASPGVRNLGVFGRILDVDDVEPLRSREPAVTQNFVFVDVLDHKRGELLIRLADATPNDPPIARMVLGRRTATRVERLANAAFALGRGATNILYANGAAEAEDVALALAELRGPSPTTSAREELARVAAESVHKDYALIRCVRRGVAFHYSHMPTQLRQAVEAAVIRGEVDDLVCTSTLLSGVNLPARNIFLFRPEKGSSKPMQGVDFWNLVGRAGRLMREFQGNIFLVDYDRWSSKPLSQADDVDVVPAVEEGISRPERLLDVVARPNSSTRDRPDSEAVFVQLLSEFREGTLDATLARAKVAHGLSDAAIATLARALRDASLTVRLPNKVLQRSPDISAHKQQRLYDVLAKRLERRGPALLIPPHPNDDQAYEHYANALQTCHRIVLGLKPDSRFHRFIAVLALKWMRGMPLPRIVQDQLDRNSKKEPRFVVREALELIEKQVRFQSVRLLGCYQAVLIQLLVDTGRLELARDVPDMALYLEMGAADRTSISLMSLGVSRPTAIQLARQATSRSLDVEATLAWLVSTPDAVNRLGGIAREEVESILRSARPTEG
jgi:hypothetical protein